MNELHIRMRGLLARERAMREKGQSMRGLWHVRELRMREDYA